MYDGDQCQNLDGHWYNTLGSEMILNTTHGKRGFLFGEYRSYKERKPGASGGGYVLLVGKFAEEGNSTIVGKFAEEGHSTMV